MRKNVNGTAYLLHFDQPYKHARHYLGWTERPLEERMQEHSSGHGARLMEVIKNAGIGFKVARTWSNVTRYFERSQKARGHARKCPICNPPKRGK